MAYVILSQLADEFGLNDVAALNQILNHTDQRETLILHRD